jgi:hypothetical protein
MKENKLLALGIPTYGRPDFAIRAIKNAVAMNIYDQIIISSNSHEIQLDGTIKDLGIKEITYYQQSTNVGMSLNYYEVISLCECKYLHIVSDEDLINEKNTKELYSILNDGEEDISVIILSVRDQEGELYRDASWQKNKTLRNICGDSGHFGSSIIRVKDWKEETFKLMYKYCTRKGDVYPTAAAAILSYSTGGGLLYFPPHLLEMGKLHEVSEMSGHRIYGFEARLNQFVTMFNLIDNKSLGSTFTVYMYVFYFFSHHALRSAVIKFPHDDVITISRNVLSNSCSTFKERAATYLVIAAHYLFRVYYFSRKVARIIFEKLGIAQTYYLFRAKCAKLFSK